MVVECEHCVLLQFLKLGYCQFVHVPVLWLNTDQTVLMRRTVTSIGRTHLHEGSICVKRVKGPQLWDLQLGVHSGRAACWAAQPAQAAMELVAFTLIVDDIVFPDGTTRMAQLGGGGSQTLFGFQLGHAQPAQVGLAAGVGHDLPNDCKEWLGSIGCDLSGLIVHPALRTPRAWQILEDDGRRTEVWRTLDTGSRLSQLLPSWHELPPAYQSSRFYHLCIHAAQPPMQLLEALHAAAHANGGLLSVETFRTCDTPPDPQQLQALLALCDIFSPNEAEAASIVPGPGGARGSVKRLLAAGASTVALRLGPKGAIVAQQDSGEAWRVPAVADLNLVDVTGCGNAFCGGLLAAVAQGLELRDAAVQGCVAGSVMAEWQGVPQATPMQLHDLALRRVEALRPLAKRISIRACASRNGGVRRQVPAATTCAVCSVRAVQLGGGRMGGSGGHMCRQLGALLY